MSQHPDTRTADRRDDAYEIAPGVYKWSASPRAQENADIADGFRGRPFAGRLVHETVLVDPLHSDATEKALRQTDRLDAYWYGQKLRARLERGELVIREGDHYLVPAVEHNTPCACGVAELTPARPDARLPLNYLSTEGGQS